MAKHHPAWRCDCLAMDPADDKIYHYIYNHSILLVGGLEHVLFSHILGIIIPID